MAQTLSNEQAKPLLDAMAPKTPILKMTYVDAALEFVEITVGVEIRVDNAPTDHAEHGIITAVYPDKQMVRYRDSWGHERLTRATNIRQSDGGKRGAKAQRSKV